MKTEGGWKGGWRGGCADGELWVRANYLALGTPVPSALQVTLPSPASTPLTCNLRGLAPFSHTQRVKPATGGALASLPWGGAAASLGRGSEHTSTPHTCPDEKGHLLPVAQQGQPCPRGGEGPVLELGLPVNGAHRRLHPLWPHPGTKGPPLDLLLPGKEVVVLMELLAPPPGAADTSSHHPISGLSAKSLEAQGTSGNIATNPGRPGRPAQGWAPFS